MKTARVNDDFCGPKKCFVITFSNNVVFNGVKTCSYSVYRVRIICCYGGSVLVHRARAHRLPIVIQQLSIVALMNTTYFTKIHNHKSIKSAPGWLLGAETRRVTPAHAIKRDAKHTRKEARIDNVSFA